MAEIISEETAQALLARLVEARTIRQPSMAAAIGQGGPSAASASLSWPKARIFEGTPYASSSEYPAGSFVTALWMARDRDAELQARGKASLEQLGFKFAEVPETAKATLGATGATGGYVLPNNLVDTLVKPEVAQALYTAGTDPLLTVRNGVDVRGVDLPFRPSAPARMTFQDWGATKENVSETYGSYTATLGTIARVMDIGKQYLRFSAGAAEQDVMDELLRAAHLAENYYTIAGAGTGSVGSGDPTTGVYTAITAAGLTSAYTTAFAGTASNTTVAGSAANGLLLAIKALAARSVRPTAAVMDAATYFGILAQGSDTAGFWLSNLLGAGFTQAPDGSFSFQGVRLLWDPAFDTNTGTTKRCLIGNWKAVRFYRGLEFRIDTTDQAGDRWDKNLVGYRGEEEIAVHAAPAVQTGNFQLITGLIP